MNPQIIQRDAQVLTVDFDGLDIVVEAVVEALKKKGHHILILKSRNGCVHWASKETDGYVREPIDIDTWSKELCVNPYEADHMIWMRNIRWWFTNAMNDTNYVNILEEYVPSYIDVFKMMEDAIIKMGQIRGWRNGKKVGGRRGDLDRWFRSERNSFVDRYIRDRGGNNA